MLPDEAKTKEQLINELAGLRQRLAELEALETTHKQVEKALRLQSEIVANMVAGVLLTRVSDRMMVYANSRFEEMFGYGPGELIGKNVSVLNAPGEQTPEEVVEEIIKQLNENGVWYGEVHNIKKDGTRFWCRANISTFEHPMHGKVDVNVLEDITERKWAEEALRESEERYKTLVETAGEAGEGIAVIQNTDDQQTTVVFLNSRFPEMLGYTREEMIGKSAWNFIPADSLAMLQERYMKRQKGEDIPKTYETAAVRKDGTLLLIEVAMGITTYGGKIASVAYVRDITERKQAEEALRKSEKQASAAIEAARALTFNYDIVTGKIEWGGTIEEITGYTREEFAKVDIEGWAERIHPDDRDEILSILQEAMGKDRATAEYRFKTKKGYVTLSSISLTEEQDGKAVRLVGILQDITERRQAEETLRESEERYRALVNLGDKIGEAIVMVRDNEQGDAIQTFVSDAWPRITGYSRKELLGMSFFDLLHPRYHGTSLKRHKKKMSGEIIPGLFEMSIIRKDGTEVPIEVTSAYTTYQEKRANVAFIRDITERKRAEEREDELQRELNLSSRLASIGELAAGVAHEINNPLTGILAFSERLLRKSTDEESSRDLERIHGEASRVARVVENLRFFARRSEPKKEYSDINEILGRTLELRAYELKTSNVEVVADLAPDIPRAMVDFQQLQQVFLNIVLNAEQAMTEANGGGKLTIKSQKGKDCIRISFTDDGPGIPAENLDRVFDPFFTTREEKGGTGLGLSLCHGIVTEHGGRIYARSKPGKGATFFVELPLASERQMRLDEANIGLNHKRAVVPDWR